MDTNSYTRIKAKCLACSVHFVVCSNHPEQHSASTLFCPQCGQHDGDFIVWTELVQGLIGNEVPGNAQPMNG